MKVVPDRITFSTGRTWPIKLMGKNLEIGINLHGNIFLDGREMYFSRELAKYNGDYYAPLTQGERTELADHMIARWAEFKEVPCSK